jgi:hypothetical protein
MSSEPPDKNVEESTAGDRSEWRKGLRRTQKWLLGVLAAAVTAALTGALTTALTTRRVSSSLLSAVGPRRQRPAHRLLYMSNSSMLMISAGEPTAVCIRDRFPIFRIIRS